MSYFAYFGHTILLYVVFVHFQIFSAYYVFLKIFFDILYYFCFMYIFHFRHYTMFFLGIFYDILKKIVIFWTYTICRCFLYFLTYYVICAYFGHSIPCRFLHIFYVFFSGDWSLEHSPT